MGSLQLNHANGLHLFGTGSPDCMLERVDGGVRDAKNESGAKDECAPAKTAEYQKNNRDDDKEWRPDIGVTDGWHEQIEERIRPLLVN